MELKDGQKSYDLQRVALSKDGGITYTALMQFLETYPVVMNNHMRACGISLEPYYRNDRYVKKQYKRKRRPFSAEEASRIIARHRTLQGKAWERGA